MPKESIELVLKYEGPDVQDGTMAVQDIVPVLQGFANAYGKIASVDDPSSTHRLRISDIRPGSASIILEVWKFLGDPMNAAAIGSSAVVIGGASWVVGKIIGVIKAKKHVKKRPYSERVTINNTVIVTNSENVTLEMPMQVYELFKNGTIDSDLNKITSPLIDGRIESAEIEARSVDAIALRERIDVSERPYFQTDETPVTSSAPAWFVAKLNSLTKSTNSGFLYLTDGTRAFYRYTGSDPYELHRLFGNYDGPVRIYAVANLDESFKIVSVEVQSIERAQGDLLAGLVPSDEDGEPDPS